MPQENDYQLDKTLIKHIDECYKKIYDLWINNGRDKDAFLKHIEKAHINIYLLIFNE